MKTESFMFEGSGGRMLPACIWTPEGGARALLQICHGMTEHMGRYEALAEKLCAQGIAAAGFDLRGHGRNPGSRVCASFGEGGWESSLQDMALFSELLKGRFGEIPHYMLGFSLGSFLLRDYLSRGAQGLAGAVIMGTGSQSAGVLKMLIKLVQGQVRSHGFDNSSELVKKLSFGSYNGKFRPCRTGSDWLCSDEVELDSYLADPLCRREISTGLFQQMLEAMERCGRRDFCCSYDPELPILLISGAEDPVGDMGKGVKKAAAQMERAGLKSLKALLIPSARHDLLHERKSGAAGLTEAEIIKFIMG